VKFRGLASLIVAAATVVTLTAPASAAPLPGPVGYPARINPFTGKLTTNYLIKRTGTDAETLYYLIPWASFPTLCADDVSGGGEGTYVDIRTCGPTTNPGWFYWALEPSSHFRDQIQNYWTDLCMQDPNNGLNARIRVWNCTGGWDQVVLPLECSTDIYEFEFSPPVLPGQYTSIAMPFVPQDGAWVNAQAPDNCTGGPMSGWEQWFYGGSTAP
jgi:hypothetical protein